MCYNSQTKSNRISVVQNLWPHLLRSPYCPSLYIIIYEVKEEDENSASTFLVQ